MSADRPVPESTAKTRLDGPQASIPRLIGAFLFIHRSSPPTCITSSTWRPRCHCRNEPRAPPKATPASAGSFRSSVHDQVLAVETDVFDHGVRQPEETLK